MPNPIRAGALAIRAGVLAIRARLYRVAVETGSKKLYIG